MTESVLDRPVIGRLTLERSLYVLIFAAAIFLRTYDLGVRPYHHDESIHAFFSWKITQNGLGDYRYDPVYHGPVLYYSTALMLWLFPDNDFTGRLSAALFGTAILAFAWPLRRYLGRWGALSFLVLVAFSPAWIYFTRFVRHDIYLAACNLGAIFWAFRYGETRKPTFLYLSAAALALAFCTKEDNYFLTPIFLVAFAMTLLWEVFFAEDKRATWAGILRECRGFFAQSWLPLITSAVIFAIVWSIFYTSFGTHRERWDAVTPALSYWIGQHEIKRIGGPWWYYAPQLLFYEPLILVPIAVVVTSGVLGRYPAQRLGRFFFWLGAATTVLFLVCLGYELAQSRDLIVRGLHVTPSLLPLALGFSLAALATRWMPGRFMRFAILTSLGCLTIYGWAQEKVPWLLVPQLLPLTLVAGRWFGGLIETRSLLKPGALVPTGVAAALTLWTMVNVNFIWDAAKPAEPGARLDPPVRHEELLSYVQST
jgi:uncharacterized protein (TIGR03663 family)